MSESSCLCHHIGSITSSCTLWCTQVSKQCLTSSLLAVVTPDPDYWHGAVRKLAATIMYFTKKEPICNSRWKIWRNLHLYPLSVEAVNSGTLTSCSCTSLNNHKMTSQVSCVHKGLPVLLFYSYPKYISHTEMNNKIHLIVKGKQSHQVHCF